MYGTSDDRFLYVQRRRIEHDKWCEGCGIQRDPGSEYVMEWIRKYAGTFRIAWNNSLCCRCRQYHECGLWVATECRRFHPIDDAEK